MRGRSTSSVASSFRPRSAASFGIRPGDLIEIAVDSDAILLTKVEDRCVFCGGTASLNEFSSKLVCGECVSRLAAEEASGA